MKLVKVYELYCFQVNTSWSDLAADWTTWAHLQSDDPLVDVLPHAHLHIKLRQTLVSLCARRSYVLTGGHVLREVQHVSLDWDGEVWQADNSGRTVLLQIHFECLQMKVCANV